MYVGMSMCACVGGIEREREIARERERERERSTKQATRRTSEQRKIELGRGRC